MTNADIKSLYTNILVNKYIKRSKMSWIWPLLIHITLRFYFRYIDGIFHMHIYVYSAQRLNSFLKKKSVSNYTVKILDRN